MKTIVKTAFVAVALAAACVARAVETGKDAPDFTLTDINGQPHHLSEYKGKTVVLEWVNPGCPFVQNQYNTHNMQNTQKAAVADGVVWLSINSASYSGAQGDLSNTEAAAWEKKMGASATAYLRDQSGKVGHLYEAKTTPHLFVISPQGKLVYQGAIDSAPSTNPSDTAKATNYVKAALQSVKAGKPVEKATTHPYGCSVKYGSDS